MDWTWKECNPVWDIPPEMATYLKGAYPDVDLDELVNHVADCRIVRNDCYTVFIRDCGDMIHLSIKRNDRQPIHDWRDLQRIKNELVGPEHEGLELYPAESRVVDMANQYHLWVLANTDRFPFGFTERFVSDVSAGGAIQRPMNNHETEDT